MTDLASLLEQISDKRIPIMPTIMLWKNNEQENPNGAFKRRYVATVGGMAVDGDDIDLALAEACQVYWRNIQKQLKAA